MTPEDSIAMTVGGLTLDPVSRQPIVLLRDTENKLNLPIWIGLMEATSIASELEGVKTTRPMTHDLIQSLLAEIGATVEAIEICDLQENTYFARISIRTGERTLSLDSRPSDAIALALRSRAQIFVAKRVLEQSSLVQDGEEGTEQDFSSVSPDRWAEILEKMAPDDFKYKM